MSLPSLQLSPQTVALTPPLLQLRPQSLQLSLARGQMTTHSLHNKHTLSLTFAASSCTLKAFALYVTKKTQTEYILLRKRIFYLHIKVGGLQ